MRSSPRSLKLRRSSSQKRLRFVAVNMVLAMVAVLAPTAFIPAGAAGDPTQVNFTLEGCRNNGGVTLPDENGDFICLDAAYTTGNLGKGWNELDLVPHRVTLRNGGATQEYRFVVAGDHKNGSLTGTGWDYISPLVLNEDLSVGDCLTPEMGPLTITPSGEGVGGADQTIYRTVTLTQQANTTCVYDYTQRLALGAHKFSGSSLHSNLWNQSLTSAGIGQKRLSLPVNQVEPQELSKDMSATQGTDHIWNVVKEASPATLLFGDTCTDITAELSKPVSITVTWTKMAASPDGDVTVVTNIYAKNPASRTITVDVSDQIYTGATPIGPAEASGPVDVSANSTQLVLTHQTTVPSGTTDLNDIATATYTDPVTGIDVPGTTTATASATVQSSGSVANQTAVITDVESIEGDGFRYSVDSFTGAGGAFDGGYTAGTKTTGDVSWTSESQSDDGSVTFEKTVYVTAGLASSGSLSDTATLAGSDGFTTSAGESVALSADATVSLTINKTIPDVLTGEETVSFDFEVVNTDTDELVTTAIAFSAGQTGNWATLSGLAPGTYTVREVPNPSGEWGVQADETVTIALPDCGGSVSFVNDRNMGDLSIAKVAVGGTGTFTFDVDCDRDAYDRKDDNPVVIVGSGTATIEDIPTGTSCTVTERDNPLFSSVVIPAGGTVAITTGSNLVTFTNTANPIGITLDKKVNGGDHATSDDALLVHSGDPLNYTVVITNNGQLPLTITTLADTMVAGFAATCTQGVGSVLDPAASFTCTYQVLADDDAHNVASVTGRDDLDRDVSDSDGTFVNVINPDIQVVKTVDDENPAVGQTVTFTYVVTNTGDTTLSGVTVVDNVLGEIGVVGTLAPGASVTLTKTMVVAADSESVNIGTATGTDVLGKTVTDDDAAAITIVLGIVLEQPADVPAAEVPAAEVPAAEVPAVEVPAVEVPAELPRTGFSGSWFAFLGLALLASGLALQSTRRRRQLA